MQRRSLLKCLAALSVVAAAPLLRAAAPATSAGGIYLVDGWVLKASDLQEIDPDAV